MPIKKNLIGEKFGKLTVLEKCEQSKNGRTQWICICECGKKCVIPTYRLTSGSTKSCGCKRFDSKNFTHKMSKTRIYQEWIGIKKRCYDQKCKSFKDYGEKGIFVCKEWKYNFVSFMNWAYENGYSENLTIDRIDSKLEYSPQNCRWVDRITQNNNRSNSLLFEYNGETKTLAEWCRIYNKKYKTVYQRIKGYGYSFEKALFYT